MNLEALQAYALNGYHLERAVFTPEEATSMIAHYMELRSQGPQPGDSSGVEARTLSPGSDPLKRYPRMIDMHLWDASSTGWMNTPRLKEIASALLAQPVEILQTMLYFKPPGARGQAFHQDNLYLKTTPILGAWAALDPANEENGGMTMVRGSHLLGLLPVEQADTDVSFTATHSVMPEYLECVPIRMEPGDVLYFGGMTIHGSPPNRSANRFRRSFICHYRGVSHWPIIAPDILPEAG